jgi:SAM-dependent methyltransferase
LSFTERFSDLAGAYVAARPSYPAASINVLIDGLGDPGALAVADLGAGTGISARAIAERGPLVYAIEPNAKMREAAAPDERVRWVDGTAEATALPAASVDVVAAFQAWHWVDHVAGVAEARRILRPGGRLAAIYNERDESDPFTAAYGAVVMKYATDATEERRANALAAFAAIDSAHTKRFSYRNIQPFDRTALHQRADSSSYLPKNNDAAHAMHRELDALFDAYAQNDRVLMHLATLVVRVDG